MITHGNLPPPLKKINNKNKKKQNKLTNATKTAKVQKPTQPNENKNTDINLIKKGTKWVKQFLL